MMTAAQKTMMREFVQDYYALMETYWTPTPSSAYWDRFTDDALKLISKYQTSDATLNGFISNIVAAFLNSREEMLA